MIYIGKKGGKGSTYLNIFGFSRSNFCSSGFLFASSCFSIIWFEFKFTSYIKMTGCLGLKRHTLHQRHPPNVRKTLQNNFIKRLQ